MSGIEQCVSSGDDINRDLPHFSDTTLRAMAQRTVKKLPTCDNAGCQGYAITSLDGDGGEITTIFAKNRKEAVEVQVKTWAKAQRARRPLLGNTTSASSAPPSRRKDTTSSEKAQDKDSGVTALLRNAADVVEAPVHIGLVFFQASPRLVKTVTENTLTQFGTDKKHKIWVVDQTECTRDVAECAKAVAAMLVLRAPLDSLVVVGCTAPEVQEIEEFFSTTCIKCVGISYSEKLQEQFKLIDMMAAITEAMDASNIGPPKTVCDLTASLSNLGVQ